MTTRLFSDMLNEYLDIKMLKEDMIKRDFMLSRCKIDNTWKGGAIPVPFQGSRASSVKFGGLTDAADIASDVFVRGELTTQKELFGSLLFHERDLKEHNKSGEQSFIDALLSTSDDFLDYMKQVVSVNLLNGSHFGSLTADATANDGTIYVDHPERFCLNQKVTIQDSDASPLTGYVSSIDMEYVVAKLGYKVILMTTRGGATVVDFTASTMEIAKSARCYNDGAVSSSFTDLRSQLLSLSNGGDATLFGKTKLLYPYLQAQNHDGSSVTGTNIIEKIFDFYVRTRQIGKGNPTEVIMSYDNLASVMKIIEGQKGAYKMADGDKAKLYAWTSIEVMGPKGQLTFTGVNECDNDIMYIMDWKDNVTFYTNDFFYTHTDPDGKKYYTVRTTDGFYYIVDIGLRGEFVTKRPANCGVIHTISY